MVRVVFCGISHETNTFVTSALGLTGLGEGSFEPVLGERVLAMEGGYLGGMVDVAGELGYELVGLLYGNTQPSGTISDVAYESMRDEILTRLTAAMPVDVVAIENHGAGVAQVPQQSAVACDFSAKFRWTGWIFTASGGNTEHSANTEYIPPDFLGIPHAAEW